MFELNPDLLFDYGEVATIAWHTGRGCVKPVDGSRDYMFKLTQLLDHHLPFEFRWRADNKKAEIKLCINKKNDPDRDGRVIPRSGGFTIEMDYQPWTRGPRWVAAHELGHALGLTHPGPKQDGRDPDYDGDDTIMSYNRGVRGYHTFPRPRDLQRLDELWDPVTGLAWEVV